MGRYLLKKAGAAVLTIIFVLVLNFLIIHIAPGDPARILSGLDNPSPEVIETLREKYGLDKPLQVQLVTYFKRVIKGDLGHSIVYDRPVWTLIRERLGATLLLTFTSAIIAFVLGSLLGAYSATRQGSRVDAALSFVAYLLYSMPSFWLGLMLILIFASWLKILPTSGMVNLRAPSTGILHYLDVLWHLILPATTLSLVQIPAYYRITRSSVSGVLKEDFITMFRASGMDERKIFRKYAFKNAILPTVTVFGLHLAYVVTGAALVEIVFAWPGMGRLMLGAIYRRDYPLLMGIYLIMSLSVAVTMIVVDILYAVLDPRIRYT